MSWGEDWNVGPAHVGICPDCEEPNGDCTDGICDYCISKKPVKCPQCNDMVDPKYMTSHGVCTVCMEFNAERFTQTFLTLTK